MDEERLDLSALSPDPVKWESIIDTTMARVDESLRDDPLATIAAWGRPLLLAAAAARAIIIPVEIALELRESRIDSARRLAEESATWVAADRSPSGSEILRTIASGVAQ